MSDARGNGFLSTVPKRGFCNHTLLDEAEFIAEATTGSSLLYLGADDYAPEVDDRPSCGTRVAVGRCRFVARLEISPAAAQLDRLEDIGLVPREKSRCN